MADMLGIKVSLDLDVMEASRDLTSQINKLTIPPVVVDLKIGKVLGLNELQNEDFSKLRRNFQDAFTLSNGTLSDFRGSMESIERILSSKITEGTVNKFKELSNTLSTLGSSFEIDNTVLSRFEKVNDMLKEFNSLSKEAQSVLLKKSNATAKGNVDDLTDKVKSDSRMSIKEFQNAIINQQNAIDRALQQSSDKNIKSITRYLDATEGLKEIVRKQLDTWQTLTEQTFADGSKLGKITVDIESNLKKMEKAYESSVASIRKYSTELYKAIDTGDLDKVSSLQNVIGVFEETRDKIKKEVANSPFSEQMAEKFLGIDTLNKYLLDMANNSYDKGVSDKEIKKATDSYLSSVKEKAKELDSLNRELKKAKVDGLTEYANELVKEVNKARSQLSKLLNMDTVKSIYPDDIGSRMQLRRQASDIVETYEDVTRMFRTKMDSIQSKKLEESGLNTFLADFKKNATEIESLEKKLATALNSGEFDYASDLQKRVDALNLQQKALKENAQSLAQYEKALKDIQAVEQKSKDNVELHNSYLENKSKIQQQKAESKLLEQQQAEDSKQRANELKAMSKAQEQYWNDLLKYEDSIAKGYESVTKTLAKKQNEYIQAIADDNISSAHSLQKSVEYWNNKKNEILSEINKTNFTQDFYDRVNNIDAQNNLFISEFESKLTDKLNKQLFKDNDKLQKEQLQQENKEIKELIDKYSKNATELAKYKKELLSAGEGTQTESLLKSRISTLEDEQRVIADSVRGYNDYAKALNKIGDIQNKLDRNIELATAKNNDKISSGSTAKENEKILEQISREREKLAKALEQEQKALIDTYEKYSRLEAQKQKEYISALVNDDSTKAKELEKYIEMYSKIKSNVFNQITEKGLDNLFSERLNFINKDIELKLGVDIAGLSDKLNKKELQESSKALKEFVDEYDKLYKQLTNEKLKSANLSQKGRDIEVSAHKENISRLEAEIKAHKEKADALKLSAKAQKEIDRINAHYDNEFATGMSKVSQNIQIKTYNELKKEQDEILARYKQLYNEQEKFNKALSKSTSIDMYEKNKGEVEKLSNELEKLESQITSLGHKEDLAIFKADKSIAESRELSQAIEKVRTEANSLLDNLEKLSNSGLVDKSSLENLKATVTQLSNVNLDGTVEDIREMNVQLSKSKEAYKELKQAMENTKWESDRNIKLTEVFDQVNKFKNDFGSVIDSSSLRALEESAERLAKTLDKDSFTKGAKELTSQLKHARNEMDGLVSSSEKYNFFEDLYDNMRTFQLGDLIVDGVQDALYSVKDIIVDLDSAMANVKKVAIPIDVDSVQKLEDIKNRAIEISKEVGMASTDVINAIADTIQTSGYAMEEAIEIARQTMMLANVGEMSQESATEGVVSMLSGFKLQPLKEVSVVVDGVTKSTNQLTDAMDQVNYVG